MKFTPSGARRFASLHDQIPVESRRAPLTPRGLTYAQSHPRRGSPADRSYRAAVSGGSANSGSPPAPTYLAPRLVRPAAIAGGAATGRGQSPRADAGRLTADADNAGPHQPTAPPAA